MLFLLCNIWSDYYPNQLPFDDICQEVEGNWITCVILSLFFTPFWYNFTLPYISLFNLNIYPVYITTGFDHEPYANSSRSPPL